MEQKATGQPKQKDPRIEDRRGAKSQELPPASRPDQEAIPTHTPPPVPLPRYDFAHCRTRLDHMGPYVPEDVIAAIRVTAGNFTEMSVLLGRGRTAIRNYIYANIRIKEILDEEREIFLDQVEQTIREIALVERDPATIRFILATQGRERGWGQKVEHTGEDGGPLAFELKLNDSAVNLKPTTVEELLSSGLDTEEEKGGHA